MIGQVRSRGRLIRRTVSGILLVIVGAAFARPLPVQLRGAPHQCQQMGHMGHMVPTVMATPSMSASSDSDTCDQMTAAACDAMVSCASLMPGMVSLTTHLIVLPALAEAGAYPPATLHGRLLAGPPPPPPST